MRASKPPRERNALPADTPQNSTKLPFKNRANRSIWAQDTKYTDSVFARDRFDWVEIDFFDFCQKS
jgi:hypothetical protein